MALLDFEGSFDYCIRLLALRAPVSPRTMAELCPPMGCLGTESRRRLQVLHVC